MKRNRAFWDASAIVPLCVYESDSSGNNPRRKVFVCFDDRLATIAEEIGFNVIKT